MADCRRKEVKHLDMLDAIGLKSVTAESHDETGTPSWSTASCAYKLEYIDRYPHEGKSLPENFVKYFIPDAELFRPMGKPGSDDWMANHKEGGQSFRQYLDGRRLAPDSRRRTIYLLPLVFVEDPVPAEVLEPLQEFAAIFFGLPVNLKKTESLAKKIPNRLNDLTGNYQVNAGKILKYMADMIPSDAFCVAAITMCDLYPRDSWNFVFGLANLHGRRGVYSLARYLSNFQEQQTTQFIPERDSVSSVLQRACKTMCHEIGHMFGLKHCIHYQCLMNGSNHLEESDARPCFLCQVCLRKLHFSCQFDITERYQDMLNFWTEHNVHKQVDWLQKRLRQLSS